jgi:hypothetical protein
MAVKHVDPYRIVGPHPFDIDFDVDLKWYRGAARYNNGCTRHGRKYEMRRIIRRCIEYQHRNDERFPWLQNKELYPFGE